MTIYNPDIHATPAAARGEQLRLFYAVNKLLNDAAAAGMITLVESETAPTDTSVIWLHITKPETENGIPKAFSGGSWVTLTKELFAAHIGAGGDVSWGEVQGTLSNQTDLQSALNGKASVASVQAIPDPITMAIVFGA